ncbi:MAG: PAS domain S-box protein [Marinilabiliaceae bacterium]|nr:PAS domain S-box protein [Marinilabiliaceae bacterium]
MHSIFKADWVWETDRRGKFTYASQAAKSVLGYEPHELIGRFIYELMPGNITPPIKKMILEWNHKPKSFEDFKYQMIGKDGRVVYLITNGVPLYDTHNIFSGFRGLSKDITDLQRSGNDTTDIELRLIETELFLRQCQFLATIGHWKFNLQTKQLYWSEVLYRIFSVSQEEFTPTYENRLELIHPEDRNRVLHAYQRHIIEHEAYNIRYRLMIPNRAMKHVQETCETHFDSHNRPLYSLGTVRDISSQVFTLRKLQESEFKYDDLYENSVVGYYRTTLEGKITMINPTLVEMLGYSSAEELKQIQLNDTCFDKSKPRSAFLEQIEQTGKVIDLEAIWKRKDGSRLYVSESARAIYNDEGEIQYFDGTVVDITTRKEAQEAVAISDMLYKSLFDAANDAIFIMKDDHFIDCNEKTLEIFACTKLQILNQSPYKFSPPHQPDGTDSKEKALQKINAALNGIPQSYEWKHQKYDETPFDAEVSLNKLELSSGIYLQAIVRDISDRKNQEAKIKKLNKKLELEVKNRTQALQLSEQKFNDISGLLPGIVFEIDLKGKFTFINKYGLELLGFSLHELSSGINILEVIPGKYHKQLKECLSQRINGIRPLTNEYHILNQSGNELPILIHSLVVLINEQPIGIRGIMVEKAMCKATN